MKLTIGLAALIASLAVAFYYAIYLPRRDEMVRVENHDRQDKAEREAKAAEAKKARVADAGRLAYRTCVVAADADYNNRWNSSCATRARDDERALSTCLSNGISEDYCRSTYRVRPSANCELSSSLAESYDRDLKEAKNLCLAEFEKGAAAPGS